VRVCMGGGGVGGGGVLYILARNVKNVKYVKNMF
jgi:hypothetical protein